MVVLITKEFLKSLKKNFNKQQAKKIVEKLRTTNPTDGKFIAIIKSVLIKELKHGSHRFYFVQNKDNIHIITKQELKQAILKFVAISKKNNQQKIIDKLKEDLKQNNFLI